MSQVPAWFARKFEFNFPVEQYPNLCVRLRGTPARLEEMLRGVSRHTLVARPTERDPVVAEPTEAKPEKAKWSAQEHAGHLLDLEPLWLARVEDFVADDSIRAGTTLTVTDLSNRKTDEANHNARQLTEILAAFRKARLTLMDRVEKLQPADFTRCLLHPRLKQPMRLIDHLYFVAEHDDHHLARIWEMISA